MKIVKSIEDNREFSNDELEKKLTKTELAHLVYFFASNGKVREFVEKFEERGGCLTCLNALKKLGVIEGR